MFLCHFAHWQLSELLKMSDDQITKYYNVAIELYKEMYVPKKKK